MKRRRPSKLLGALWFSSVVALVYSLTAYSAAPGAAGGAPDDWPATAALRHQGRPTLVMLAHPRCPCTRASVAELERLMAQVEGVDAYVLMTVPQGVTEPDAFRSGLLWDMVAAIPGVKAVEDPGGHEAARFGAMTSGHLVLYDAFGRLQFSGGITPARGHEGASMGQQAIRAWVKSVPSAATSSVFGCPLRSDEAGSE